MEKAKLLEYARAKLVKIAIVQHGKDHEGLARIMWKGMKASLGENNVLYCGDKDENMDLSDVDFFFIWNKFDGMKFPKMTATITSNMVTSIASHDNKKCGNGTCNLEMDEEEFIAYRLKDAQCKICNFKCRLGNNFIFIFYGPHLLNISDQAFRQILSTRFWTSTDADWRLFRCLPQPISFIPHTMLESFQAIQKDMPEKPLAVFCSTIDENYSLADNNLFNKYMDACVANDFTVSSNLEDIPKAWVYIDRMEVGVPSVYAIKAMAIGIPVIMNRSKFHVSHYPDLPAIQVNSIDELGNELWDLRDRHLHYRNKAIEAKEIVIRKFGADMVTKQWINLAEYILSPHHFIDHFQGMHNIPKYWGFQGGYSFG
jgi:hypothetical protein